jgi:serine protease AprX
MRRIHGNGGASGGGPGTGTRTNALWGKGRKRYSLLLVVCVLAMAVTAGTTSAHATDISNLVRPGSEPSTPAPRSASVGGWKTFVPKYLTDKADSAKGNTEETFSVIIQASDPSDLSSVSRAVGHARERHPGRGRGVQQKLTMIGAVTADVTGDQLDDLAADDSIAAITEDVDVYPTGFSNAQSWVGTIDPEWGWVPRNTSFPTIAIVDSGVQGRSDFSSRLLKQVDFTTGSGTNSGGDGFGHGTMVAGLAAGENSGYAGAEPRAKIVSLDVLDDAGFGKVSDVLAACDWILRNKNQYDIQVANFSINAGSGAGIANDPLDKAVEKLWLNGVVVVAAAGNYAVNGAAGGVGFAPANDPFVITVGASDTNNTTWPGDDFAAPWSAWGYTQDGFRKPEIAAPGRMMNAPVQKGSLLWNTFPSRKVADGYLWMSGTSFAAPLVSGAAASIVARHPDWTPDQVKGALMEGAHVPSGYNSLGAMGVGILDIDGAVGEDGSANPNTALNRFVVTDYWSRLRTFDASSWEAAAAGNPAWDAASWSSASWSSASWSSASWSSASWSSASWSSASWSSASWASMVAAQ